MTGDPESAYRIHYRAAILAGVLLCCFVKMAGGQTTQPWIPPLMVSGSADRLFIVWTTTEKDGKHKTLARGQALPGGEWVDFGVVWGQASALAQVQGDMAISFADGTWKRVGQTFATGANLPREGPILAWASGKSGLYGIRSAEGGAESFKYAPVTQPATTRAASPPATRTSLVSRPVLFHYDKREWTAMVDLPPAAGETVELCIAGNRPVVAAQNPSGKIKTWSLSDGRWSDWGEINVGAGVSRFGLLATASGAALWTMDANGAIKLHTRGETEPWKPATAFAMPGNVPLDAKRAFTFAGEEFRLIVLKDNKFLEQRYDGTGAMRGGLVELPTARATTANPFSLMYQMLVLLAMALIMIFAIYRRRKMQEQEKEKEEE